MRIGLIGSGRMGQAAAKAVTAASHEIVATFDSQRRMTADALSAIDVLIDFSVGSAVKAHAETALAAGCALVTGTTAWENDLDEISAMLEAKQGRFLYAANFSIGVLLFQKLAQQAARLFGKFENYDVAIHEIHHRQKIDSPSGTAKMLADAILPELPEKDHLQFDRPAGKISPSALQVSASRVGAVPGTHSIIIDSAADTIQLTHTARGRMGFAQGALQAAEWIIGKRGFFSITDMIDEIIGA